MNELPIIKAPELVTGEEDVDEVLDKLIKNHLIGPECKDHLRTELLRNEDCYIILRLLNKLIDLQDYFDPGSIAEKRGIAAQLVYLKSPITVEIPKLD